MTQTEIAESKRQQPTHFILLQNAIPIGFKSNFTRKNKGYNMIRKQKIQILIDQRQWRKNFRKPWCRNSTDFSQQLSNSGHTMVQKMALEGMERNEKKFKRKTVTMAQHKEESEMSQ